MNRWRRPPLQHPLAPAFARAVESLSTALAPSSARNYGIVVRKDDVAFKKVADAAMTNVFKSGQINAIYDKWFLKPIPPKGLNLNVPMSPASKKVIASPTDSGDPAVY